MNIYIIIIIIIITTIIIRNNKNNNKKIISRSSYCMYSVHAAKAYMLVYRHEE